MESKLNLVDSNSGKSKLVLLPVYFRWIGLGILILAILYPLFIYVFDPEILKTQKETAKMILLSTVNLGLFIIALSRGRNENEATMNLRLRSLVFACILGIVQTVLEPLKDLLVGEPLEDSKSQGLVLMLLLTYLVLFFLQKKALDKSIVNTAGNQ